MARERQKHFPQPAAFALWAKSNQDLPRGPAPGACGTVSSWFPAALSTRVCREAGDSQDWRKLLNRKTLVAILGVVAFVAISSGAFAAQKYLITSSSQVKPGAIGYASLSADAKHRLAGKTGAQGPAGPRGADGAPGAKGAAGPAGPKGDTGSAGAAGATGATGATGPQGPAGTDGTNRLAKASGLVAWTGDPAQILQSATDTSGSIHGASVALQQGDVITSLAELVATAGVGMTHGAFGIYDSNLNLVAHTADSPSSFEVSNQWVQLSLTSPYTVPSTGVYYFADLLAAGTTMPAIGNIGSLSGTSARNTLPGGVLRGINGAGAPFTAFPSTLTNNGTGLSRCIVAL